MKQIILRIKKKATTANMLAAAVILVALLGAGGWFTHAQISANNAASHETALAEQNQPSNDPESKLDKLQSSKNSDDEPEDKPDDDSKAAENSAATEPTLPAPKYSISSDPRSTAYSAKPPKQNPASFNIKITRPAQVAAGTLISYNATKGEKIYYGGDLILTPSTVTLSKSTNNAPSFSISLPDGLPHRGAMLPWDEQDQAAFVAFRGTSMPAPATSITQIVQLFNNSIPNGTYRIHMVGGATSNEWVYHGFLTVIVTD